MNFITEKEYIGVITSIPDNKSLNSSIEIISDFPLNERRFYFTVDKFFSENDIEIGSYALVAFKINQVCINLFEYFIFIY